MKWPGHIVITGLFFIGILPEIQAQNVLARKVTIDFHEGTREQYFDTAKSQCNIRFLYTDKVNPRQSETIFPGEYTVKQLLDSLFVKNNVYYLVRDDLVILSPQTKKNILEERVVVKGHIVARKEKAVPFATVYLKDHGIGTIANSEGHFRLIIPAGLSYDTLIISSMGYELAEFPPEEYLTNNLKIKLKPAYFPIKDIIVRPDDPEKLVMQSYTAIEQNYNTGTSLLTAFFRESSKQNEEYISLTEALIEINKSSYISSSNDLIRLVKGRNGTNINQSELINLVVEGGLYNGLRLDVAKYGSYFYGENALENCDFRIIKSTFYNNRQTYIIGFDMKEGARYAGFRGKLFIDAESLALVRVEFELSPVGIDFAKSELVKKTPKGFKAKPVYAKYEVEYRYYNDVWNLHYARSELGIKVKKARGKQNKGYSCDFTSTAEFVVTDENHSSDVKFRYRDAVKSNDVLVKQVRDTQSTFWLEDNVIVPEEPLLSTIKKLQKEGFLPDIDTVISKDN